MCWRASAVTSWPRACAWRPNQLERFREAFEQVVADELGGQPLTPALLLECELDFQQASDSAFLQELELMQPFGAGNAEPVFASPELTVVDRSPWATAATTCACA